MGIWDKVRAEFIDIIEWKDDSSDTLVWRFPRFQDEIKQGAQLTVRESQMAVFVNEGKIADVFSPGRYKLQTANLPVLATLKGWKYGFDSPFKAEVYFISTRQFTDQKWGTANPVMLRDPELGPIRVRAFGSYVLRVKEPALFIREIAGTDSVFTTAEITEQLRNRIITRFSDMLAESSIPVIDLARQYEELSLSMQKALQGEFGEYGLELPKFLIENVSLPPEVEEALDRRSSMGIVGNLDDYTKFQAANAMQDAAQNPGGDASAGVGMGIGFAMANQLGQSMNPNQAGNQNPPGGASQSGQQPEASAGPPDLPKIAYYLGVNGEKTGPWNREAVANKILSGEVDKSTLVWKAGMDNWESLETMGDFGNLLDKQPPPLP